MKPTLEQQILSADEARKIISAALEILARKGVKIENQTILAHLKKWGADVNVDDEVAFFPVKVVRDYLDSAKCDDIKKPISEISFSGSASIYYGHYLDPRDDEYKPWNTERMLEFHKMSVSLDNIDGCSLLGMPAIDWPVAIQPLTEKLFGWKYGLYTGSAIWDKKFCEPIFQMLQVYGKEKSENPAKLFGGWVYIISPLFFSREEAAQYEWFYQRGFECSIGSLTSQGGSAPCTHAGALALHTAENIFMNIMRNAFWNHKDIRLGSNLSTLDMRTGSFRYGRPEQNMSNMAGAAIARELGAVSYTGHAGYTDSFTPSSEAAMTKVTSTILNATATGRGWIAAGLLGTDEVFSPIQMVFDDEWLSSMKYFEKGISITDELIGLDNILETPYGGSFIGSAHTSDHFRKALWEPKLWSRENFSAWKNGGTKNDIELAREKCLSILSDTNKPEPQISSKLENELINIIKNIYPEFESVI